MAKTLEFNDESVLKWIADHAGIRYQVCELAKRFEVPTKEMTPVVKRLAEARKILTFSDGKKRIYFLRTAEEQILRDVPPKFLAIKPLTGYEPKMRQLADICVLGR